MANAAAFLGGGLLAGLGQGAIADGKAKREDAFREADRAFRTGERVAGQEYQSGENEANRENQRTIAEDNRAHQATESDKKIAAEGPERAARSGLLGAQAEWYKAGKPTGAGKSGGTEFERLADRLNDPELDDDMRGAIQDRLAKLRGGMSDDQKRTAAQKAAQTEVKADVTAVGAKAEQKLKAATDKWMKFYGVGEAGAPRPSAAPKPDAAPVAKKPPGAGTKDDPYKPTTTEDYDAIAPGEIYINPADGKPFRKKAP